MPIGRARGQNQRPLLLREYDRSLGINADGFPDVVVWNPWVERSAAIADLPDDGFRRMLVNGCFWAAGLEAAIRPDLETAIVGPYRPSWMKGRTRAAAVKPQDLAGWDTPVWPEESK